MSSWVNYIKNRIKNNKNFLGFVSGATGSGKTYSSIQLCFECDPTFNQERVVFNGLELMTLITSGKLKTGSAICFEEVGVAMDAKQWQSKTNRLLSHLVQTFRHRNYILFFNSPFIDFVDASIRKLFHAEFETTRIDTKKEVCILKPKLIQYNAKKKKFYYKRLRMFTPEGLVPIDTLPIKKPSEDIIKWYEKRKDEYSDELQREIYSELRKIHDKKTKKKELTEKQAEIVNVLNNGNDMDGAMKKLSLSKTYIYDQLGLIKKKGYEVKSIINQGVKTRYIIQEKGGFTRD